MAQGSKGGQRQPRLWGEVIFGMFRKRSVRIRNGEIRTGIGSTGVLAEGVTESCTK